MAKVLTPQDLLERAKTKAFISIANKKAQKVLGVNYPNRTLEVAFETVGCSCHPDRGQLEKLIAQRKREVDALFSTEITRIVTDRVQPQWSRIIEGSFGLSFFKTQVASRHRHLNKKIQNLGAKIQVIDAKEHPALDIAAHKAKAYLPIWLLEQTDMVDLAEKQPKEIAEAYAKAWIHEGWRPKNELPTTTGERSQDLGGELPTGSF